MYTSNLKRDRDLQSIKVEVFVEATKRNMPF